MGELCRSAEIAASLLPTAVPVALIFAFVAIVWRYFQFSYGDDHSACEKMIFEGSVQHTRFATKRRRFEHSLMLFLVEINDTTESAFDAFKLWTARPLGKLMRFFTPASFDPKESLSLHDVKELLRSAGETTEVHRVFLLTHLRYFGYRMNPVSYYYVYDRNDCLLAMISEVTNTPWEEMKRYIHLIRDCTLRSDGMYEQTDIAKEMHVSPFFEMSYSYTVVFSDPRTPDRKSFVSWSMKRHGGERDAKLDFYASMTLFGKEATQKNLTRVLLDFPLMTWKVITLIYFHAAMLFFVNRVPFVPHPDKVPQQERRGAEERVSPLR